ncbi:MAG TPA: copper resistance protein NlpE, partial [Povalibacter sp.]
MKLIQASLLFGLGIFIAGCERNDPAAPPAMPERPTSQASQTNVPTAPPPAAQHAEPQLPALYAGVLPCADCEGIRYQLDLRADSVFFLRTTYLGKAPDAAIDDAGQWAISSEDVLALRGRDETPLLFSIMDAQTLRKLDLNGT